MRHEDTKTEVQIRDFRDYDLLPDRLTLRFIGACSKRDLSRIARKLDKHATEIRERLRNALNRSGPRKVLRLLDVRIARVASERRQRGYLK